VERVDAFEAGPAVLVGGPVPSVLKLRRFTKIAPPIVVIDAIYVVDLLFRVFTRHHLPDDTVNGTKATINPNLPMSPAISCADFFSGVSGIVTFVLAGCWRSLLPRQSTRFRVVVEEGVKLF